MAGGEDEAHSTFGDGAFDDVAVRNLLSEHEGRIGNVPR
jgi:hypothetical protein